MELVINATSIIKELDELMGLLLQGRCVFPTLREDMVGHCHFRTADYYLNRGYAAEIHLQEPITADFIKQNLRLGKWINENAIIRLYGIMEYHELLKEIGNVLPGWKEVNLMRRMRNVFTKTYLGYSQTTQRISAFEKK